MPNKYYDEDNGITDHEDWDAGAAPPDTGPNGGKRGESKEHVKESSPDWGLRGAPTQPRDRSLGIKRVKVDTKREGL